MSFLLTGLGSADFTMHGLFYFPMSIINRRKLNLTVRNATTGPEEKEFGSKTES